MVGTSNQSVPVAWPLTPPRILFQGLGLETTKTDEDYSGLTSLC